MGTNNSNRCRIAFDTMAKGWQPLTKFAMIKANAALVIFNFIRFRGMLGQFFKRGYLSAVAR